MRMSSVMAMVAYATPASPYSAISRLVASAEARMLTRLLPSRMEPMKRSWCACRRLTTCARRLPWRARWCITGREAAVNAVSEPEKKADRISRTPMAPRVASMAWPHSLQRSPSPERGRDSTGERLLPKTPHVTFVHGRGSRTRRRCRGRARTPAGAGRPSCPSPCAAMSESTDQDSQAHPATLVGRPWLARWRTTRSQ